MGFLGVDLILPCLTVALTNTQVLPTDRDDNLYMIRRYPACPTLMGRILPDLINYRVGYRFLKKKPKAGPGQVRVLSIPSSNLDPDPTRLRVKYQNTPIYIYIYIC